MAVYFSEAVWTIFLSHLLRWSLLQCNPIKGMTVAFCHILFAGNKAQVLGEGIVQEGDSLRDTFRVCSQYPTAPNVTGSGELQECPHV